MAGGQYDLAVTKRQAERAKNAFSMPQWLYVVPYNAPWYELLLSCKLMIKTESGNFAVKTGSTPKKHRGWVGFYNSKGRVRKAVAKRHGIDPNNLNLGMLVGVGYLEDSRELTLDERYQWYLRANKTDDATVIKKAGPYLIHPSTEEKVSWLDDMLYDWEGHDLVITGPMPIGHFYRPNTLKHFSKPIPVKYPQGPVGGTKIAITPEIRRAIQKAGVRL